MRWLAQLAAVVFLAEIAVVPVWADGPENAEANSAMTTYGQEFDFLKPKLKARDGDHQATALVELFDPAHPEGARVLVSPVAQGRVLTSSARGSLGRSYGWINRAFVEAGRPDRVFNNFGGEDRFWLAPEAGQYALFFAPGVEQNLPEWFTPPGLNEGEFATSGVAADGQSLVMERQMQLINASGTRFHLDVKRTVRLAPLDAFRRAFGDAAADALSAEGSAWVGFATENQITNRGPAWQRATGLVTLWILGQFAPGPETVIILPYRPGAASERGPVVNGGYFQELPPERLKTLPGVVLFAGDGKFRSKIGLSSRRARPVAGAIDFRAGVLTLVHYSLPEDAADQAYANNLWHLPQAEPYVGDALNSYNDGPNEAGGDTLGGFFELETLSPARELATGESLSHAHATYHIEAAPATLAAVARAALGVELDEVRQAMGFAGQ